MLNSTFQALLFSVNDVNKLEEIDSTFQILSFSVSISTQHHIDISNQVALWRFSKKKKRKKRSPYGYIRSCDHWSY